MISLVAPPSPRSPPFEVDQDDLDARGELPELPQPYPLDVLLRSVGRDGTRLGIPPRLALVVKRQEEAGEVRDEREGVYSLGLRERYAVPFVYGGLLVVHPLGQDGRFGGGGGSAARSEDPAGRRPIGIVSFGCTILVRTPSRSNVVHRRLWSSRRRPLRPPSSSSKWNAVRV